MSIEVSTVSIGDVVVGSEPATVVVVELVVDASVCVVDSEAVDGGDRR